MPIYEYKCVENGHEFEVLQSISEAPPEQCKHCSSKVEKLVSKSAFHLKGSGWYTTDYKEKPKSTSGESAKTESAEKPKASDSKSTESKPAETKPTDSKSSDKTD
jgi:putative FmdB family regulatory protein